MKGLVQRVGRRGATLLLFAFVSASLAFSLQTLHEYPRTITVYYEGHERVASLLTFGLVPPLDVWSALWATVSITCLVQAFKRKDRGAFTLTAGVYTAWALCFLASHLLHPHETGRWSLSFSTNLLVAGFVLMVSGWRENGR